MAGPEIKIPVLTLAALGIIALGGCKTGPDYTPPPPPATPAEWPTRQPEPFVAPVETAEDLERWWTVFEDTTLNRLIREARIANLQLAQAVARVRQSRARLAFARSQRWPILQVGASGGASKLPDGGTFSQIAPDGGFEAQALWSVGVDAAWEVDLFGRVSRSIEAAGASYRASIEDYRYVLVTLLAEVALVYLDVRTFQQRIAFARENADTQRGSLTLTRDRFESGLSSELDVAQAEANLADTEAQIPPLEAAVTLGIDRLAVLLGVEPGDMDRQLYMAAPIPQAEDTVAVGLPADLVRQRPDIRAAESELAAQTARVGVASAALYPQLAIEGRFGFFARDLGNLFDGGNEAWQVKVPVAWTAIDGGARRSRVQFEDAGVQRAAASYRETVLLALAEVRDALVSLARERERSARLANAAQAYQRAAELVQVQYETGLTDFQNVLDTQRSLFQVQDALAGSEGRVSVDLVNVYKALGGGWSAADTVAGPTGAN